MAMEGDEPVPGEAKWLRCVSGIKSSAPSPRHGFHSVSLFRIDTAAAGGHEKGFATTGSSYLQHFLPRQARFQA